MSPLSLLRMNHSLSLDLLKGKNVCVSAMYGLDDHYIPVHLVLFPDVLFCPVKYLLTEPETARTERRSRLTPYEGDEWRSPNMAVPGMMEGRVAINDLCRVGAEASENLPTPGVRFYSEPCIE
jgi:hypothetical protein